MATRSPQTTQDLLSELSQILQAGDPSSDEGLRQNALRTSSLLTASLRNPSEFAFETCFLVIWISRISKATFKVLTHAPGQAML